MQNHRDPGRLIFRCKVIVRGARFLRASSWSGVTPMALPSFVFFSSPPASDPLLTLSDSPFVPRAEHPPRRLVSRRLSATAKYTKVIFAFASPRNFDPRMPVTLAGLSLSLPRRPIALLVAPVQTRYRDPCQDFCL